MSVVKINNFVPFFLENVLRESILNVFVLAFVITFTNYLFKFFGWILEYAAYSIMPLKPLSWFLFWPSLLLIVLNLARNEPLVVPEHDGVYVAEAYFKPGQTFEIGFFVKIVNG